MAPLVEQTITVYRGEDVRIPFTMTPVENIGGRTLMFTVARRDNTTSKLIGPLPMSILSAADGTFFVDLSEEQLDIKPGTYRWDTWRVDEGLEQPYAKGPFVILGSARVPPIE